MTYQECEYMPEVLEQGVLYHSPKFKVAIHLCACGCGDKTVTPTGPKWWSLSLRDGRPTLYPSIGNQQFPCRSHYFLTDGKIIWCK